MYKNFNLTESEKEEILKQHMSYGYGKSLNEQYNDGEEIDEPDMDSEPELEDEGMVPPLKLDTGHVYIGCDKFTLIYMADEGGEAYADVRVVNGELVGVRITHNETDVDDIIIRNMVKEKAREGIFKNFPTSISWDMDNDTCYTN